MGGLKLPPEKRNKLAKLTPDIASMNGIHI